MNFNQNNGYNQQPTGYPPVNSGANNNTNNYPNNPNQQMPYQQTPNQPLQQQGYTPNQQMYQSNQSNQPNQQPQQSMQPNPYPPGTPIVHGRPVNLPPFNPPTFGQPNYPPQQQQQQPPVFTPMGQHHPTMPVSQPQFMPYQPPYSNDPSYYTKPFPANQTGYLPATATAVQKEDVTINPQNADMINKCRKCRMLSKAYEYQHRNMKKFNKYNNLATCLPHTCGRLN
eukprot:GAHX01000112.1.p1 GENE.GAHX01000112.1~~GAHX01000112.1.p1  ORF type:complete len:227 (+),score=21.01 GAHX01000112.1:44-724(+)